MRLPAFPWGAPTRPGGVPLPPVERETGVYYDTSWSRRYEARLARALLLEGVTRPLVHTVIPPRVEGLDRIEGLEAPAVFAANHNSHLDTPLILSTLPRRFRHRTVVAGAADYFFDTKWKAAVWSLTVAAVPIERIRVSRRFLELGMGLLADGWSVVIYPEGGRSPDGWAQPFIAGVAYLAYRARVPLVPLHIAGTSEALPKGARRLRPGRTAVTFGRPMPPDPDEDPRRLSARLEAEVAALADEHATDWWQARRRAAAGATPALSGPDAPGWRRSWARTPPSAASRSWPHKGP
ncbi:MAG TPA: lysophospholipid acyltransferase family protein [Acidimicrobiales bacterium]|nr:lysophospholipid acyltransferase family protein [Acidimicrobiales bacterium]